MNSIQSEDDMYDDDIYDDAQEQVAPTTQCAICFCTTNALFIVAILTLFFTPIQTIDLSATQTHDLYYHCTHNQHLASLYSIPEDTICIPLEIESVHTLNTYIYAPTLNPLTNTLWKCMATKCTICTNVGFFGSRGIVLDQKKKSYA